MSNLSSMAEPKLTPAQQALLEEAERGRALLDAGVREVELVRKFTDTGMKPETARVVVGIAKDLQKREKRIGLMSYGIVAALVLVPVALIFGGIWIYNATRGVSQFEAQQQVLDSVGSGCSTQSRPKMEIINHNGEQVILIGASSGQDTAIRSNDEGFVDAVMSDDEIAIDHAICLTTGARPTISCDGYYSEEVLDALALADSPDEAFQFLDRDDPNFFVWANELAGNGRTLRVEGLEVRASMTNISSGEVIANAQHERAGICPDSYYESNFSGTPGRASVVQADIDALLAQLA